jgi:hypothetical protein
VDDSWSFKDLGRVQTSYLTHGYHRYPAKFIPQLTARLIKENSRIGDLVCDPFMGSGTTLVEAVVHGRRAYGSDINPVAVLISKAKTTPIDPALLKRQISPLLGDIKADIGNKHHGQMPLLVSSDNLGFTIPDNIRMVVVFVCMMDRLDLFYNLPVVEFL